MADSTETQFSITTTGTGTGPTDKHIFLPEKESGLPWMLFLFSDSAFDVDLQNSCNGTDWGDAKTSPTEVANFTGNDSCVVQGNQYFRMDVNSQTDPVTLLAK